MAQSFNVNEFIGNIKNLKSESDFDSAIKIMDIVHNLNMPNSQELVNKINLHLQQNTDFNAYLNKYSATDAQQLKNIEELEDKLDAKRNVAHYWQMVNSTNNLNESKAKERSLNKKKDKEASKYLDSLKAQVWQDKAFLSMLNNLNGMDYVRAFVENITPENIKKIPEEHIEKNFNEAIKIQPPTRESLEGAGASVGVAMAQGNKSLEINQVKNIPNKTFENPEQMEFFLNSAIREYEKSYGKLSENKKEQFKQNKLNEWTLARKYNINLNVGNKKGNNTEYTFDNEEDRDKLLKNLCQKREGMANDSQDYKTISKLIQNITKEKIIDSDAFSKKQLAEMVNVSNSVENIMKGLSLNLHGIYYGFMGYKEKIGLTDQDIHNSLRELMATQLDQSPEGLGNYIRNQITDFQAGYNNDLLSNDFLRNAFEISKKIGNDHQYMKIILGGLQFIDKREQENLIKIFEIEFEKPKPHNSSFYETVTLEMLKAKDTETRANYMDTVRETFRTVFSGAYKFGSNDINNISQEDLLTIINKTNHNKELDEREIKILNNIKDKDENLYDKFFGLLGDNYQNNLNNQDSFHISMNPDKIMQISSGENKEYGIKAENKEQNKIIYDEQKDESADLNLLNLTNISKK